MSASPSRRQPLGWLLGTLTAGSMPARAAPAATERALRPAHAASNEAWISQAHPLLEAHGQLLRGRLEAVLQPALPELLPVDAVACAGHFAGAYSHAGPAHTVMPSTSVSYQGDASLEMLFHEASLTGMDSRLIRDIDALLAPRGLRDQRQLWHATQFFTVGHLTQRVLAKAGSTHEP